MKELLTLLYSLLIVNFAHAENGYDLWLRYHKIEDADLLKRYRQQIHGFFINASSPTLSAAKAELGKGLAGLLDLQNNDSGKEEMQSIVAGKGHEDPFIRSFFKDEDLQTLGKEGFIIRTVSKNKQPHIIIAANEDIGVLYGVFHFLRMLQTHQSIEHISISSVPKIRNRILDHWDNLNRTVERGYAGLSIFNWHTLPDLIDQRYVDYARANASIGINGTVVTNVNANALSLTRPYLIKLAALAAVFRPYGIKVYLTARFSAPIEIGGLKTADPLDVQVKKWWQEKINEIYQFIPDFGGFLVKANSEGQPGPQNYGRTHADGANLFADALAPHGGLVMWRAFVYNNEKPDDRFKQAYNEFKPLDGQFHKNVLLQVKNGPIDFQPREPFHPLFGAMPQTNLMMEFQLTQEYLGQATHLVYEAPLFKEVLLADTHRKGKGTLVSSIIEGQYEGDKITGIAGVSNIGNEINWTGHPFGQANWYAFGKLAWNPDLGAGEIADEWIKETFTNNQKFVEIVKRMMLASREITVDYMTPLGLHHVMGYNHHYGPAPWYNTASRPDWNPTYYHKADAEGIGFDRTESGSNALAQYAPEVQQLFTNLDSCPENYLLWFHHVSWNHRMRSGRTLWEELCFKYNSGVDSVKWMQNNWESLKGLIDEDRYNEVNMLLAIQEKEAVWWRNASVLYFQTFSKMPLPKGYPQPDHDLEYYESLQFPYAPGIGGNM